MEEWINFFQLLKQKWKPRRSCKDAAPLEQNIEVTGYYRHSAPPERRARLLIIPFRLNNSAYDVWIISFTFSVGGDQTSE